MTVFTETAKVPSHAAHRAGSLSPKEREVLWDMEEHFWTSGADKARATTATNAVMIFPYPPGILQGDHIWTRLKQNTGWRSLVMRERRVMRCGEIAILTYRASAEKPDVPIFKALCASTYLHDEDRWLRLSHQQTTVS
ncbi:hypothetical protein [Roseovarius pacificus]|uniref:hypothetical protein n=1 Tax=Roseovarius pacificus TaxID=337701 RepID=UPI00259205EB|nr:hypothetical protein [Roseovarius pacificus]